MENFKKLILNLIIMMKNFNKIEQLITNIQMTRILSIVVTDIFKNHTKLKDMNISMLNNTEINYINDSFENFYNMLFNNIR